MKRHRHISLKECYAMLCLKKGATLDDLKRAYRRRAFELHPDLNPDPTAPRQFQLLSEAYVVLSHVLLPAPESHEASKAPEGKPEREPETARETEPPPTEQETSEHKDAGQATVDAEPVSAQDARSASAEETRSASAEETHSASAEEQRRAAKAYAQEDVLRDLLNDPFARRVFEDIYSEVHRNDAQKTESTSPTAPASSPPSSQSGASLPEKKPKALAKPLSEPRKTLIEWGKYNFNVDFSKGVKGAFKGWLRQQIDEEQVFKLPASSLQPGARIRLQIRRGLSDELSAVEITLPKDFVVGKPVRLRGLGKKIGPWQGDLYLTLEAK